LFKDFDVVQREIVRFKRGNDWITLGIAAFEGTLAVGNAELLTTAMKAGIGRAKAYGCGLLTLAGT
jgi:CRISPR system Cascade subunit CasE